MVKSSNCVSGLNCDKAKQPGDNNVTECTLKKKKKPWEAPLLVKQKKWLFSASMKEELTLFFLVFFLGGVGGGGVGLGWGREAKKNGFTF